MKKNSAAACRSVFGRGQFEDVGLDSLGVEDAGRQTEQGVNVGLFEELATDCLAGATFEEDIVGHNDRGAAVLLQDRKDVLEEVELFVS